MAAVATMSYRHLQRFLYPTRYLRGVACSSSSSQMTETPKPPSSSSPVAVAGKPMSMAMKYYLDKKRAHDAFIATERSEFELGRKHLANMMGMEEASMTQEDVDKAIEYLFPSGLYSESARPLMRPPDEIFPKQKDPEFDADGRPHHPFFYTVRPNFTRVMYDVVDTLENCLFLNDRMFRQGKRPDPDIMLNEQTLSGTRWVTRAELEARLMEEIKEGQYKEFLTALERLTFQHFSYKFKDFVMGFRVQAAQTKSKEEFIQPEFGEDGRAFVEALGQRHTACAKVRVTKPGSGKLSLLHLDYPDHPQDITYFYGIKERQQVMYPLQFTKLLGLVDVDAIVYCGGSSSQAGAIRYATSLCLKSFVDQEMIEEMSMAGLLTQNIQVKERKKPGQEGARRKYTWKKR